MTVAKQGSVTYHRLISEKMSGSRNANDDGILPSVNADCCHWCLKAFRPGQMRYPILDSTNYGTGWEPVSVCMECFKRASPDNTGEGMKHRSGRPIEPRREMKCAGCGEPVFASPGHRWRLLMCSARCCQRVYRKRRRKNGGSAIDWKGARPRW
jgi:hypothetical protein